MTMSEGVLRADALTIHDGRLSVAVHLPWYRSLPISCLDAVDVRVDGVAAAVGMVATGGYAGTLAAAAVSDAWWDVRDPLDVTLDLRASAGVRRTVDVDLSVRIPYLQQAPGVPLVQRTTVQLEAIVR
jgi:hypothetical protein